MNIRFTSTLTHEDEKRVAPAVLAAVSALLNELPIAYSLRIDTIDGSTFIHTGHGSALLGLVEATRGRSQSRAES